MKLAELPRRAIDYVLVNWGSPFFAAFAILLAGAAWELATNSVAAQNVAEAWANAAFYFLVLGVAFQFASYAKYREDSIHKKPEALNVLGGRQRIRLAAILVTAMVVSGAAYYAVFLQGPTPRMVTVTFTTTSVSTFTSVTSTVTTLPGGTVVSTINTTTISLSTSTFVTSTTLTSVTVLSSCDNWIPLYLVAPTPITAPIAVQNELYVLHSGSAGVKICYEPGLISFSAPSYVDNYSFSDWGVVGVPTVGNGSLTLISSSSTNLNLTSGLQRSESYIFAGYVNG